MDIMKSLVVSLGFHYNHALLYCAYLVDDMAKKGIFLVNDPWSYSTNSKTLSLKTSLTSRVFDWLFQKSVFKLTNDKASL